LGFWSRKCSEGQMPRGIFFCHLVLDVISDGIICATILPFNLVEAGLVYWLTLRFWMSCHIGIYIRE
jgi:hypothetical protein